MSIQFFTPRGPRNEVLGLPSSPRRTVRWLRRTGDIFPYFTVETTRNVIRFRDRAKGHWVHLFSHPAAHTPICTTELVSISASASAWDACNVRHIALTGSAVTEQIAWHKEIEALFGTPIDMPGAHDPGLQLTRLFGMRHDRQSTEFSIRESFIIDPAQHIRMMLEYPGNIGRNTEEVLRVIEALQPRTGSGATAIATPMQSAWCRPRHPGGRRTSAGRRAGRPAALIQAMVTRAENRTSAPRRTCWSSTSRAAPEDTSVVCTSRSSPKPAGRR